MTSGSAELNLSLIRCRYFEAVDPPKELVGGQVHTEAPDLLLDVEFPEIIDRVSKLGDDALVNDLKNILGQVKFRNHLSLFVKEDLRKTNENLKRQVDELQKKMRILMVFSIV